MHDHSRFQRDINDVTGVSLSLSPPLTKVTDAQYRKHFRASYNKTSMIVVCIFDRFGVDIDRTSKGTLHDDISSGATPASNINLFADDTSAYVSSQALSVLNSDLQTTADSLWNWFSSWRLSVHPAKTVSWHASIGSPSQDSQLASIGSPSQDSQLASIGSPSQDSQLASIGSPSQDCQLASIGSPSSARLPVWSCSQRAWNNINAHLPAEHENQRQPHHTGWYSTPPPRSHLQ